MPGAVLGAGGTTVVANKAFPAWTAEETKMIKFKSNRGAWVAQSVERPTSAQGMILRFVSSSPASGFELTVQSPLGILSPPLLCLHTFSQNKLLKTFLKRRGEYSE